MKYLLFLAIFTLSSCTTVDYWYNYLFVVPKNPFPEQKQSDGWIVYNPMTDPIPTTRKKIIVRYRNGVESDGYVMHKIWGQIPDEDRQREIVAWRELSPNQ